jgi:hypothetical protein
LLELERGVASTGRLARMRITPSGKVTLKELRRDGSDVHRESEVPVLYGPRWERMCESVSPIRDAMRGSRMCVRVCVDPSVRADRVASSK